MSLIEFARDFFEILFLSFSLYIFRAKLEAKRKQEQLEQEEQAKIEQARRQKAEKKEVKNWFPKILF